MKKRKVFIAVPSTGVIHNFLHCRLREMEERYKDSIEFIYPEVPCQRIFHDYARNGMVEDFLETDAEVIWFIDSDVTPPPHALDLVTMHWNTWELAGCPYPVFITPPDQTCRQVAYTVYKGHNTKALAAAINIPNSGTEFVDGIATGCLFIKREVFKEIEKPYFEFTYNKEMRNIELGEDLGFCLKMIKLGKQFFIDYSMVCKHEKTVCLLEVNNYAMDFAKKAIVAYDEKIRGQVNQLVEQLKAQKASVKNEGTAKPSKKLILDQGLVGLENKLILPPGIGSPSSGS